MTTNETQCKKCAAHYGDSGQCDDGKPVASPHRQQPDALTRLERLIGAAFLNRSSTGQVSWEERCRDLISKARKEMEWKEKEVLEARAGLAASQEVLTRLSNKSSEALRMGQQQGRVELAQEMVGKIEIHGEAWAVDYMRRIIDEDAGQ